MREYSGFRTHSTTVSQYQRVSRLLCHINLGRFGSNVQITQLNSLRYVGCANYAEIIYVYTRIYACTIFVFMRVYIFVFVRCKRSSNLRVTDVRRWLVKLGTAKFRGRRVSESLQNEIPITLRTPCTSRGERSEMQEHRKKAA